VIIEWNNSHDTLGHSLAYSIFYSVDNGNSWIQIASELDTTSYSWVLPNLANGTEIILKIQSIDEMGFQATAISQKKYVNSLSPTEPTNTTSTTTPGSGFDASLIVMILSILFGGGSGVGVAVLIQRIRIGKG
jgi:hypothetical protein